KTRTVHRSSRCGSEFAGRSLGKGAGIKPVLNRVDLGRCGASGIARNGARFIGIADLIRALESVPVIGEEHSGSVTAIYQEKREARGGVFDDVYLPVAQNGIRGATPATAEVLAFTKWQIVKDAGGKVVVEI